MLTWNCESCHQNALPFICLKFCSDKMLFMSNAMLLNYTFVCTPNKGILKNCTLEIDADLGAVADKTAEALPTLSHMQVSL